MDLTMAYHRLGGKDEDLNMVYNVDNITRSWEADVNNDDSPYSDNNVLGGMTYENFITFVLKVLYNIFKRQERGQDIMRLAILMGTIKLGK